jgi:GNAT superfamily N-acetyltransferase
VSALAVRRLTQSDDLTEAIALLQRFFEEEGFTTPAEVIRSNARKLAGLDACGLFVAVADGRTIGVATVSMEFGIEYGWSAEMGDLYIVPEWRDRGVSARIVAEIEKFLIARDASGFQVTVTAFARDRHDLEAYYRKLGFEGEGRKLLYKRLKA